MKKFIQYWAESLMLFVCRVHHYEIVITYPSQGSPRIDTKRITFKRYSDAIDSWNVEVKKHYYSSIKLTRISTKGKRSKVLSLSW